MEKPLAPFAPYAYAILRIIAGLLFVSHGGQKLFGWFGGQPVPLGSLFGLAGIIEIILGLLITIGLLTAMPHSLPAVKWLSLISSAIFRRVFGRLKTQASQRCYSASSFCIWQRKVPESGVSMRHVRSAQLRFLLEGFLSPGRTAKSKHEPKLETSQTRQKLVLNEL
jgi:hypothetical protein